jgi:outer membrane protein assembly factor BamD
MSGLALLSIGECNAQVLHKKKKKTDTTPSADNSAEPDKVLYGRAMNDIKKGRQEVGRLSLQTLINTYPDSEYLAKAKLAIADSYYKEGGTSNLSQAIQAYKDFGIFFPFLPEAAYAQLQVANAHYKQMAKPDRDRTEAKAAEEEFQTFLTKYPKDPLAPVAQQRLRNVQEIIAEGDYRIGYYYYVKGDKRAAAGRLITLTKRYPLYSKTDKALWMLGDIFESSEKREIASVYYSQIIRNYPLSQYVPDAKNKLAAFKVPIPQADPKSLAWMTAEQNTPRQHDSLVKKPLALVRSAPHDEMIVAARNGTPNLEPESENDSATEVLRGGNHSQLGGSGGGASTAAVVEVVTPGSGGTTTGTSGTDSTTTGSSDGRQPAADSSSSNPSTGTSDAKPEATTPAASPPGTPDSAANGANPPANGQPTDAKADAAGQTPAQGSDAAKTDGSQTASQDGSDKNQKESTSKKKKGLRKIIPW